MQVIRINSEIVLDYINKFNQDKFSKLKIIFQEDQEKEIVLSQYGKINYYCKINEKEIPF